jgi:ABC-type transport system substrate-binding protein
LEESKNVRGGDKKENEAVIGTGPLKLLEYNQAEGSYLYEANQESFMGEPIIDRFISMKVYDVAIHPESEWYYPGLPSYEYNPTKANETLDSLGFIDTDSNKNSYSCSIHGDMTLTKMA